MSFKRHYRQLTDHESERRASTLIEEGGSFDSSLRNSRRSLLWLPEPAPEEGKWLTVLPLEGACSAGGWPMDSLRVSPACPTLEGGLVSDAGALDCDRRLRWVEAPFPWFSTTQELAPAGTSTGTGMGRTKPARRAAGDSFGIYSSAGGGIGIRVQGT